MGNPYGHPADSVTGWGRQAGERPGPVLDLPFFARVGFGFGIAEALFHLLDPALQCGPELHSRSHEVFLNGLGEEATPAPIKRPFTRASLWMPRPEEKMDGFPRPEPSGRRLGLRLRLGDGRAGPAGPGLAAA